ncbi:MAG: carboxypeptidase regulatory-like domain-containing protein [Mariniphaga sp.]|nr:carboxypeptidase regulatory-like domain-containing protein [Mariniphaga sp.]
MKLNYLTVVLLLIIVITSCGKDKDSTSPPITKANIIGTVNLYDEGKIQIDKSAMTVKVVGITSVISATTDVDGRFTLIDVPFGTYTLTYEKSGFGTFKKFGLEHSNNGSTAIIINAPSLGQSSSTQVTNLIVSLIGKDVVVSITTNPAGSNGSTRYIRYFLSTSTNVSAENYTYFSPGLVSQINPKEVTLTSANLSKAGFLSGQTIYVKVYGDSFWSNEYDDLNLGRKVFPNLNTAPTNSVSFVMQ